ncbi:xaa-Pro aminopeptidase 3 [Drosophila kikkawai]|uniref:Xaa-Pro aminopeptidase 3 n=1 Tax=Drosophila kikkawai TaxID=30033 RepID=A0A6P4I6R0_DROKI|nr:xaa-Pro aminopeptidase 3 [Drosophila kikkawai]
MLRLTRNLKCLGFSAGVRCRCTALAEAQRSDVHLVLPTVLSSEFAKEIAPLSVPVLIDKYSHHAPGGQFATVAEYLHSDPKPSEALVPGEIDLHRAMTLDGFNAYMQAKAAFYEPRRKVLNFAHVLVVAGADFLRGCPFRQRSEFLYLCDCLRPGSALLLHRSRKQKTGALLFLTEKVDPELARVFSRMHHVDEVLPLDMLKKSLSWILKDQSPELWHTLEQSSEVSRMVSEVSEEANTPLSNPRYILQYTRTFKTDRELSVLRRANGIAAESMAEVIAYNLSHPHKCDPRGMAALFDFNCRRRHAHPDHPFSAKVACGSDGTGLWHMDAGCQYGGYHGGLVRSWPGSGRFTPPQKMLYSALLDIRRDLCALIEAAGDGGAVSTPQELHAAYLILLAGHLRELRILSNTKRSPAETVEAARKYNCTPVVVSHVGIEPQDTSGKLLGYPLAPRNVLSLRLSISIPDDCCEAYPEFRGILCQLGDTLYIRDDYTVEVLTAICPSKHHPAAGSVPASARWLDYPQKRETARTEGPNEICGNASHFHNV